MLLYFSFRYTLSFLHPNSLICFWTLQTKPLSRSRKICFQYASSYVYYNGWLFGFYYITVGLLEFNILRVFILKVFNSFCKVWWYVMFLSITCSQLLKRHNFYICPYYFAFFFLLFCVWFIGFCCTFYVILSWYNFQLFRYYLKVNFPSSNLFIVYFLFL